MKTRTRSLRTIRDPHHGGFPEWGFDGSNFYQREPAGSGKWRKVKRVSVTPKRILALASLVQGFGPEDGGPR